MNRIGTDIKINMKMGRILLESSTIRKDENTWIEDLLINRKEPVLKCDEIYGMENTKRTFFNSSLFDNLYKTASSASR